MDRDSCRFDLSLRVYARAVRTPEVRPIPRPNALGSLSRGRGNAVVVPVSSAKVAGELVTLPSLFVTVTAYWPTLAAVTAGSSRLSPVAPAIAVPLKAHWYVTPAGFESTAENVAKSPGLTSCEMG